MDKREAILSRIYDVLSGLQGLTAKRNDINIDESELPVAILLDGDEDVESDEVHVSRNRPPNAPQVIRMSPEIYFVLSEDPVDVGPDVNYMRNRILRALLLDEELTRLLRDKDIRYEGMQTGLNLGRSMLGEGGLLLSMTYVLYPSELPEEPTEEPTESGPVELEGRIPFDISPRGSLRTIEHIDFVGSLPINITPRAALRLTTFLDGRMPFDITPRGHIVPPVTLRGRVPFNVQPRGRLVVGQLMRGTIPINVTPRGDLDNFDRDAQAIINAMVVPPTATRGQLINATVMALKNAGLWGKLDFLYMTTAHDEQAARLNWKNPNEFTLTGPVTWEQDQYIMVDGAGVHTGFHAGEVGDANTLDSATLGALRGEGLFVLRADDSNNNPVSLVSANVGGSLNSDAHINNDLRATRFSGGIAAGLIAARRNGNTVDYYADGTSITSATQSPVAYPQHDFYVQQTSTAPVYALFFGAYLNSTEMGDLYAAFDEYLTAITN